jgi:hypothetical protein
MEKRLINYLAELEAISLRAEKGDFSPEELAYEREKALTQISFFQHERLIHLIVTVTFAVLTLMSVLGTILSEQLSLSLLVLVLLILLVPYVRHYYILENGVQRLYTFYDKLL